MFGEGSGAEIVAALFATRGFVTDAIETNLEVRAALSGRTLSGPARRTVVFRARISNHVEAKP